MITLKEYEDADWTKIDDAIEPFMPFRTLKEFNDIVRRGISVTAIEDGNVMACGGIAYVNENEGIIWVKVSKKCIKKSYRWARSMLETFRLMKESLGGMTITTYILEEFCRGERMAKFIGMKKTGVSTKFKDKMYNKYAVVI